VAYAAACLYLTLFITSSLVYSANCAVIKGIAATVHAAAKWFFTPYSRIQLKKLYIICTVYTRFNIHYFRVFLHRILLFFYYSHYSLFVLQRLLPSPFCQTMRKLLDRCRSSLQGIHPLRSLTAFP